MGNEIIMTVLHLSLKSRRDDHSIQERKSEIKITKTFHVFNHENIIAICKEIVVYSYIIVI